MRADSTTNSSRRFTIDHPASYANKAFVRCRYVVPLAEALVATLKPQFTWQKKWSSGGMSALAFDSSTLNSVVAGRKESAQFAYARSEDWCYHRLPLYPRNTT